MKRLSLFLILFLGVWGFSYAQRTITGKVSDQKGDALIGASILVTGTTVGTVSDVDGSFSLALPANATTLSVSYTGFASQVIEIGNQSNFNIQLVEGANLSEVIITALGIQKQPREVGYAVTQIKNKELTQASVTKLQNGLVGKVSGLNVSTVNNGIGADTRIVLRGIRSLTGNNQALLVVDGTPMALGYISSINPNDVESVNVLKGANSATLYGPEGVNGVIVITTKKGSASGKPTINISNSTLFEQVNFMPDFQKRFGAGSSTDAFGDGIYDPIENQSWGTEFDGSTVQIGQPTEDGQIQEVPFVYLEDEKFKFWDIGLSQQNDISISSGDQNSNFFLSFQNVGTKAVMPYDKSNRSTLRLNAGKTYGIFNAGLNLGFARTDVEATTEWSESIYWLVVNSPGHIPLTQYRDLNSYWANHNNYYNDYYENPYADINNYRQENRNDNLFGNLVLGLKPAKWFNITNRLGYTSNSYFYHQFNRNIVYTDYAIHHRSFASGGEVKARVWDGNSYSTRLNNELVATAEQSFGKMNVKALVGNLIRKTFSKGSDVSGSNLVIPTLFNVGNRTGEPGASSSYSETALTSVFGSVTFGYNNLFFVELTGRNDWDSRLPANDRSYFYPGVNASLILTDLVPSISNNVLSSVKLKGAYAQTGNVNVGAYSLESTFSQAGGFPYGALPGFTADNTINNPEIKPELVKSLEFGAELGFFNSNVQLDLAYYKQQNDDQVIPVSISNSTGFSSALLNAAQFDNWGFEVDLKLQPLIRRGGFVWEVSTNYTFNDSEITSIYEGLDELSIGNTAYAIVGYPAYVHKLKDWQRVRDVDPNSPNDDRVIIDPLSGYPQQNPVNTIFGRTNPKHIFGLNTDLTYKDFNLKVVAEYRGGHYIYNSLGFSMDFTGTSRLSGTNGRQRFVFPNSAFSSDGGKTYTDNTDIVVKDAHYSFLQAGAFRNVNTNYYSSAAFWKLREVVLSYNVPARVLGDGKYIKGATLSLVGRNLLMLRPKTNWWTDPEFANTTGNAVGTTTINQTPPTRLIGFNVNLTF